MDRCLWIDIAKRKRSIIFVNIAAGISRRMILLKIVSAITHGGVLKGDESHSQHGF